MRYQEASEKLSGYRRQINELREKMRSVQQDVEPEPVKDYEFAAAGGKRRLSELFGDKTHLFVIHNMGAGCRYCTLWADGFNGVLPHLQSRAAFVIASPDDPANQQKFKASRNWRFEMVSSAEGSFAADMGYREGGNWHPGVSVFEKRDGKIYRVSDTGFGPGDEFCSVWHFLDLLPGGAGDWEPKYKYG